MLLFKMLVTLLLSFTFIMMYLLTGYLIHTLQLFFNCFAVLQLFLHIASIETSNIFFGQFLRFGASVTCNFRQIYIDELCNAEYIYMVCIYEITNTVIWGK